MHQETRHTASAFQEKDLQSLEESIQAYADVRKAQNLNHLPLRVSGATPGL